MTTTLIIGSGGFTGPHVVQHFREDLGHEVHGSKDYGVDVTKPDTIRAALDTIKPDIVINLAGVATLKVEDERRIYEINGFGVLNILKALTDMGFAGHFVTASSGYVYGNVTPDVITESMIPVAANHYSCATLLAEHFCDMMRGKFLISAARVFNCIGRGHLDHFLVPKIVRHFRERAPHIELGNTQIQRDSVDIRDIARMYGAVATHANPPHLLNFCSGTTHSIADIIAILHDLTGHNINVTTNPAFMRSSDNPYMCGSNARLKNIGFTNRYNLRNTLQWMLEA